MLGLVTLALAGCEFGRTMVPQGRDQLVVHSILNPSVMEQQILVEHSLTGRLNVAPTDRLDEDDPIRTGGGVPVTGARVTLYGPNGAVAVARERTVAIGNSQARTGVYIIMNSSFGGVPPTEPQIPIVGGGRYRLVVEDSLGRTVTGSTTIPQFDNLVIRTTQPFNRDTDTLVLRWNAARYAKQYALRLNTPRGPFFIFTDTTELKLAGSLRNFFSDDIARAFVPGFFQEIALGAVDTNYFDYYRSGSDPFTGSGLINRLEGGIGLFGSYVPVVRRVVDVVANEDDPIEGTYHDGPPALSRVTLRLYVESQREDIKALSGRLNNQSGQFGVVGTLDGTSIRLAMLRSMSGSDTLGILAGTVKGDSLLLGPGLVVRKSP